MTITFKVASAQSDKKFALSYIQTFVSVFSREAQLLNNTSLKLLVQTNARIVALVDDATDTLATAAHVVLHGDGTRASFQGFVTPEAQRDKGYGRRLIQETIAYFDREVGVTDWMAVVRVMPDGIPNEASARCFEKCGFVRGTEFLRGPVTFDWTDQHLSLTAEEGFFRFVTLTRQIPPAPSPRQISPLRKVS